ncbi:TetR/AcrR family transcriptional regulator [Nocardia niigatensis]
MGTGSESGGRQKDAGATRSALLAAAREVFAEKGFEGTTVREIAARAGANQALLFRYFGNKDELFRAVVADRGHRVLSEGPEDELLGRLLAGMLNTAPEQQLWLQAALRSSGHASGVSVIRRELDGRYVRALTELGAGPDAELRADLVVAWLLGIGLLRSVYHWEPLASADPGVVADHVLRAARVLLDRVSTNFPPS